MAIRNITTPRETRIYIDHVASYLPETVITNQELIDRYGLRMKASWIERQIGILERRWAEPQQTASDLAVKAIEKLHLESFRGSLFCSTLSPDYLSPSTASIIKKKLDFQDDFPAYDLNAACAGHLFALSLAHQRLLYTDEEEALVIATEIRSRFLNKKDRRTVFLFSDGASVIHLKKCASQDQESKGWLEWVENKTIPSAIHDIYIPGGGSAMPFSQDVLEQELHYITMTDGREIFKQTTENLVVGLQRVLNNRLCSTADFDFFVFHQGNSAIIRKILDELKIDSQKTLITFHRYGNSSSASVGITFVEAIEQQLIHRGDRILLMAMGAGYNIGIASLIW